MKNVIFEPRVMRGEVRIPSSKSVSHRAIICAALAGNSTVRALSLSQDITATAEALRALGAQISLENGVLKAGRALKAVECSDSDEPITVDCGESASTLRFLIPLAAALGRRVTFVGRGRLPKRTTTLYKDLLEAHGVRLDYPENGDFLPLTVSGKLSGGEFPIRGDISSQFVTGLLFALAVIGEGKIKLTTHLESRPYADLTLEMLESFGLSVDESADEYRMKSADFSPREITVEGDCSQAAFFAVAAAVSGEITLHGLRRETRQGDFELFRILERFGARVDFVGEDIIVREGSLHGSDINASDIPDLVPALAVLAALSSGETRIFGAARLRLKESDRIASTLELVTSLGGEAYETPDGLRIIGKKRLRGGNVRSFGDHRIAMAAAAASVGCESAVTVDDMSCIAKSYPAFLDDWRALG